MPIAWSGCESRDLHRRGSGCGASSFSKRGGRDPSAPLGPLTRPAVTLAQAAVGALVPAAEAERGRMSSGPRHPGVQPNTCSMWKEEPAGRSRGRRRGSVPTNVS